MKRMNFLVKLMLAVVLVVICPAWTNAQGAEEGQPAGEKAVTAEALLHRFQMEGHIENGSFIEKHYTHVGEGRPASGSIYYYVGPEEITQLHVIDCDEYWCYNAGSPLQLWMIDEAGRISTALLGVEEGCEPLIYIKKGTIFGSRHRELVKEGTFLTCITVPRFNYQGMQLVDQTTAVRNYPGIAPFYTPLQ